MKELQLIETIKKTLSNSSYIGDDCAYLADLGIVVTQDSLVEDVHFSLEFAGPFQVGYKSVMVNLSDVYASGAVPKYLTIGLSIPKNIDENWVEQFYKGADSAALEHGVEIVGGDITSADKIFISVCAIGSTSGRKISSRKNAKVGDLIITSGVHGSSAAGLVLKKGELLKTHLLPQAQRDLSNEIATKLESPCMMDSSDGLMDVLFKIAHASGVKMYVEFDKIPYDSEIEALSNWRDLIFYGGEDYQIVATVSKKDLEKIDKSLYTIIGEVKSGSPQVETDGIVEENFEKKGFNHWEIK